MKSNLLTRRRMVLDQQVQEPTLLVLALIVMGLIVALGVQMYRRLLQFGACKPEDVATAQKELTDIRSRLDRAERLVRKKELRDGGIS